MFDHAIMAPESILCMNLPVCSHNWVTAKYTLKDFFPMFLFKDIYWNVNVLCSCGSHQWASYQIRKIAGCACAGNAGNVFPRRRFQRKPLVSDPGMHHGTCVTHVPWCMSGSLTCGDGENVPGIPGACAPVILRIWQETHGSQHGLNKWFDAGQETNYYLNQWWPSSIKPCTNIKW